MSARPYVSLWRLLAGRSRSRAAAGVAMGSRRAGVTLNTRGHAYARARVGGFTIRKRIR